MFDYNKDNNLSKAEFTKTCDFLKNWRDSFIAYDSNRNGSINFEELKKAIETFGYKFSAPFLQVMFHKYDVNGSNTISFEEFIQLFCELHVLTEEFKRRDTQRNGTAQFEYEDFLKACFSIKH